MFTASGLNNRLRYTVQHDQTILTILHECRWHDKNRCRQLGDIYFPAPTQPADFAITTSRVDGKQCHLGEM